MRILRCLVYSCAFDRRNFDDGGSSQGGFINCFLTEDPYRNVYSGASLSTINQTISMKVGNWISDCLLPRAGSTSDA